MKERLGKLRELLGHRRPWLLLLLLVALAYFGSYYRHGLIFRDEGGTEVLISKRLLEGQRPFLDVALGYNVMWFYPIVAIYKLTGVSFVALRIYCFALSTLTAVLGFLTMERAGRRPWVAFLAALMFVFVPGMTHKNYMPLLAVGNACCLLHFALASRPEKEKARRRMWRWIAIGGVALGLTYLTRIDVGIFCTLLWLGAIWLAAIQWRRAKEPAAALALGGPALIVALIVAVHAPVYLDAQRREFAEPFIAQYTTWPKSLFLKAEELVGKHPQPVVPAARKKAVTPAATPALTDATPQPASATPQLKPAKTTGTLARKSLFALGEVTKRDEQVLTVLLYLPIAFILLLGGWAAVALAKALAARESRGFARALGALVLLGACLTTFPQYFFFRPDSPHLSEFSPGYWTAVAGVCLLLGCWRSWPVRVLVLLIIAHAGAYLWRMVPDRWTGTIAVRKSRTFRFEAANGVDVMVTRREKDGLGELNRLIKEHSKPGEYLVAYPYHPIVNVFADRPTYEKNVYIDNATSRADWDTEAIKRMELFKPAIIVLSDWDVNGTDASRFSVWAMKTKTWVQTHYTYQGTYLDLELYTRGAPAAE